MSIVLLIFKIIGLILLFLLVAVLLMVALLLFCPFTYRIKGSYHEKELKLHICAFWLGYLLGIFVDTDGGNMQMYLRILGIRKSFLKHDNPQDFEDTIADDKPKTEETAEEKPAGDFQNDTAPGPQKAEEESTDDKKSQKSRHFIKEKKRVLLETAERIKQALKNFNETRRKIVQLLNDPYCKAAFHTIWNRFIYLLKKIMPCKLKLKLKYSTGSPDTTGELLGILAMFPLGYRNHWNITPDFVSEEFYAEADFDVRGHILGVWILRALLGILLDKNCQKLYNKIRSKH